MIVTRDSDAFQKLERDIEILKRKVSSLNDWVNSRWYKSTDEYKSRNKINVMDQRELILKAVDYVNDIPKRVDEFLVKERFKDEFNRDADRYKGYFVGCDPYKTIGKKKLPKTKDEALSFVEEWNDFKAHGHTINDAWIFLSDYED